MNPTAAPEQQLDAMFAALADPTRRGIVRRLCAGDATVTELAEPYAMSTQAVSQHIQVLERCGLVSRRRVRQSRPCHLEAETLGTAMTWLEESRRTWAARLDRLEHRLAELTDEESS